MSKIKNNIEEPNNIEKIIVSYIYNHPHCTYSEIHKDLVGKQHKLSRNSLKDHLYQLENSLVNKGHIIAHDERKYAGKPYPEDFTYNPNIDRLYPDVWKRRKIDLQKMQKSSLQDVEVKYGYQPVDYFTEMIWKNSEFYIDSKEDKLLQANPFGFTFTSLIFSLMIECFFNNPQNWYIIRKPEDLDFQITIKANWSKEKKIFKALMDHKKKCLTEEILYPIDSSRFHTWITEKGRKKILKSKTEEEIYHIAYSKSQQLNKFGEEQDNKRKIEKPKYLALVNKELEKLKEYRKSLLKRKEKLVKSEELLKINQDRINTLIELKYDIQKEYFTDLIYPLSEFDEIEWVFSKPKIKTNMRKFIQEKNIKL